MNGGEGDQIGTSIFNKHHRDNTFGGRKVLNIGCGFAKFSAKNVINVDAFDNCRPDIVWDLNKTPYPFETGTFDLILANHIIEHLPNWWDCFNECSRILKENGKLEIWVPGSGADTILGYRDHCNTINNCSFFGVMGTYRSESNAWADDALNKNRWANRMELECRVIHLENEWWLQKAPTFMKDWFAKHLRNVIKEDGYFFRRVTEVEYQKEMQGYVKNIKNRRETVNLRVPEQVMAEAVRKAHRE